jgi:hypothetical protein
MADDIGCGPARPRARPAGNAGRRHTAACFVCSLLAALFLPITASAADQGTSTGTVAQGEGPPLSSPPPADALGSPPRWTFSAETIVLERIGGGVSYPLVSRVPGTVPFFKPPLYTATAPGVEAFNANQFRQGFSAGPKLSLTYRGDAGYGVELSYFNVFDQSDARTIGPDTPRDWLVMKAPGIFWQTQDFPYQGMRWSDATNLYSAEANGRLDVGSRVTLLAGARWLQLNDTLVGTLTPADRTAPTWKQTNPTDNIFQVTAGNTPAGNYPPFWTTGTTNNLYGVQIGVGGTIVELDHFSLDGLVKVGLFDDNAQQSTGVSLRKTVFPSHATTNQAAFVSEAGLQLKYQLIKGLALKAGYELLWLDGIALAPGQFQETLTTTSVRALGVNARSTVLFQGATFGLDYSF